MENDSGDRSNQVQKSESNNNVDKGPTLSVAERYRNWAKDF